MRIFKKSIVVFLSFLLCIQFSSLNYTNALSPNNITSSQFFEETQQMINEYGMVEGGLLSSLGNSTNRIIVKTNSNEKIDALNSIDSVEGFNNWHIFQFETSEDVEEAIDFYIQQEYVEYVEEDFVFLADNTNSYTDDPVFDVVPTLDDYGCAMVNSKVAIDKIDTLDSVPDVIVAVFDSGLTNDNSYFDSSRILDGGKTLWGTSTKDGHGHGTHVTGIIYNNTPSNVKFRPYKVISDNNMGSLLSVALNVSVAVDKGADVINMSLGTYSDLYTYYTFSDAVSYAKNKNVPVVVAAGNDFEELTTQVPALIDDCITVSSVNDTMQPSEFSNYGYAVDVAAPGEKINSVVPYENKIKVNGISCNNHHYATVSGTSMATPFVSAAVAILLSLDPTLTVSDIETILKQTAQVPNNWDTDYGAGVVDFSEMMTLTKTPTPKITLTDDGATISAAPLSTIYFTTDGSTPIEGESQIYIGEPINTVGVKTIKAIACKEGQLTSNIAIRNLKWTKNITIRYKGKKALDLPPNTKINNCYSSKEEVVTVDKEGNITGISVGEAKVTVYLEYNQIATYNVTVEYEPWQLFIIYFLFGFLWY